MTQTAPNSANMTGWKSCFTLLIGAADTMTPHVLPYTWCAVGLLPEQIDCLGCGGASALVCPSGPLLGVMCLRGVLQRPHGCHIGRQPVWDHVKGTSHIL